MYQIKSLLLGHGKSNYYCVNKLFRITKLANYWPQSGPIKSVAELFTIDKIREAIESFLGDLQNKKDTFKYYIGKLSRPIKFKIKKKFQWKKAK